MLKLRNKTGIWSKHNFFVLVLLSSYLIQFLQFNIGFAFIKLYMLVTFAYAILYIKNIKIHYLYSSELFFILLYIYSSLTIFYAPDKIQALKLIVGQIVLLFSLFILRYKLSNLKLEQFENLFLGIGKIFIISSLIFYAAGIVSHYLFNNEGIILNPGSTRFFGLYLEGEMPRFSGLSESPNNYVYYGLLFYFYFIYKKEKTFIFLSFVSLVLTLSGTFFLIYLVSLLFFSRKKIFQLKFFIILGVVFLALFIYNKNQGLQQIVEDRLYRLQTGSGRFVLWKYVWGLILESPILGYGINQSRILIAPLRDLNSSHNTFLEILLSDGIVGLLIFISFNLSLFIQSINLYRKYKTNFFLILFLSFFLFSLSNNILNIDYVIYYLGIVFIYNKNSYEITAK